MGALAEKHLKPDPSLVLARLNGAFGFPRHGNPRDVFYCAVYVLLSAQTTLEQASEALHDLRRRWPTAAKLARARPDAVRATVHSCGFGQTRTQKILALAEAVEARRPGLSALRRLPDNELEAALVALPGIGFKSARVIAAMSSLRRDRFAIDVHIWRIAQRLGWIPQRRTDRKPTERQADDLESRIPIGVRRHLHACLVALGRSCCRPRNPLCASCVLKDVCSLGKECTRRKCADA